MRLIQQTPACSDFDVVLGDGEAPAYRVLVPERLLARNLGSTTLLHVVPGHWRKRGEMLAGRFSHPKSKESSAFLWISGSTDRWIHQPLFHNPGRGQPIGCSDCRLWLMT